jgi:hypothetical protein
MIKTKHGFRNPLPWHTGRRTKNTTHDRVETPSQIRAHPHCLGLSTSKRNRETPLSSSLYLSLVKVVKQPLPCIPVLVADRGGGEARPRLLRMRSRDPQRRSLPPSGHLRGLVPRSRESWSKPLPTIPPHPP